MTSGKLIGDRSGREGRDGRRIYIACRRVLGDHERKGVCSEDQPLPGVCVRCWSDYGTWFFILFSKVGEGDVDRARVPCGGSLFI